MSTIAARPSFRSHRCTGARSRRSSRSRSSLRQIPGDDTRDREPSWSRHPNQASPRSCRRAPRPAASRSPARGRCHRCRPKDEAVEDERQLVARDARAVVVTSNSTSGPSFGCGRSPTCRLGVWRIAFVNEVREHLGETHGVGIQPRPAVRRSTTSSNRTPASSAADRNASHGVLGDRARVDRLAVQRQHARLGHRERAEIVQEPRHHHRSRPGAVAAVPGRPGRGRRACPRPSRGSPAAACGARARRRRAALAAAVRSSSSRSVIWLNAAAEPAELAASRGARRPRRVVAAGHAIGRVHQRADRARAPPQPRARSRSARRRRSRRDEHA